MEDIERGGGGGMRQGDKAGKGDGASKREREVKRGKRGKKEGRSEKERDEARGKGVSERYDGMPPACVMIRGECRAAKRIWK